MISVITCPRPGGVKYLYPLLAAVSAACPDEKRFLFCDGSSETWPGWCSESFELKEKLGRPDNKHIGWKAIERAAGLGEDLLFLEDDVFPADEPSLVDAVRHSVPESCAYTSFHRTKWTTPGVHESGLFTMSQAVKIPFRSFAHLFAWRRISSGDWEAVVDGFDKALAEAGHNARWMYEQTERNYFNHVGEISAIHNDANGRSIALG